MVKRLNKAMYYFSQTDNQSLLELKQQTTSADGSFAEIKIYKFDKPSIKFTDLEDIEENTISEETEENFYKKVFETKGL